jgi:hypothetical protein
MTDFVNRLLGETSPGAPPIRPLIGSLFEPRPSRDVEPEPLPTGEVTENPLRTVQLPLVRSTVAAEREPRAHQPESPRQPDGWTVQLPLVRSTVAAQPESPRQPDAGPEPWPPAAKPPAMGVEPAEPAQPRHRRLAESPEAAPTRPAARTPVPPDQRPTEKPPAAAEIAPQDDRRPPGAPAPVVSVPTVPVRDHPVDPAHATARPAVAAPAAVWPPSGPRRTAEPTVRISIGRVEVKAAQETAAPQRKQPNRRPAMSLDDYLRKRAEGSSR